MPDPQALVTDLPPRAADIERVVLSWPDPGGVTKQELRCLFSQLGETRFEREVAAMRAAGNVVGRWEERPNRAGWPQPQLVFRRGDSAGA